MTRLAVLTFVAFVLLAAPARGDGGPAAGFDAGPAGVTARGIADRYITRAVPGGTLVLQVERRGGALIGSRLLHDELIVPAVAFDGTPTGLSADGRTLVLAGNHHFAVLDTETLRVHQTVRLRGTFALDAISPDGRRLYLIQSLGARYAVRAYDLPTRRLLPRPIVDPAEADEPMNGVPISRVMSRDGRWAYTLYDDKVPFIHALDTAGGRAKCVDLDALAGRAVTDMRLRLAGDGAVVVRSHRTLLAVDPRSFAVRRPAPPVVPDDPGSPWPLVGLAALALLAAVAIRIGVAARRANFGH